MNEQLEFYFKFQGNWAKAYDTDKQQNLSLIRQVMQVTENQGQKEVSVKAQIAFDKYYDLYIQK